MINLKTNNVMYTLDAVYKRNFLKSFFAPNFRKDTQQGYEAQKGTTVECVYFEVRNFSNTDAPKSYMPKIFRDFKSRKIKYTFLIIV